MAMYQRILVPVDGSPTSNAGLDEAVRLAKLTGARIRLVHVPDANLFAIGIESYVGDVVQLLIDAGAQLLAEAKARVEASGVAVDTVLGAVFGERVCDVVNTQVTDWQADLVVIGTHGRRGARRLLLGSDAEQIVRSASVPVLLVRTPWVRDAASAGARAGAGAPVESRIAA